jgi:lipoate---protein ligase
MSAWRLICDDDVGAADGLALDEALMHRYGRGEAAAEEATLRLYTYAPHCALVGRYQDLAAELDLDACRRHGVQAGRRPTGGGAIIMGPAQLGVAVTTRAPTGARPRELLRDYARGIIAGLARVGVEARFRGKNDLEAGGRKIAGLGLYVDERGALLFHASVLADLDVELMLAVLRIPGAKLAGKGIARVQERVTTVTRETGREWSGAALREEIAAGVAETLAVSLERERPSVPEREEAAALAAHRYGTEQWLRGRMPTGGARGTAACRTPEGLLRVYVGVQGGALSSVLVTGDFTAMPPELLRLEAALRWCRADPERIVQVARREGAEPLAAAVWEAAQRALGAAPVRIEGSCYFPEVAA